MPTTYCVHCGTPLVTRPSTSGGPDRLTCPACGRTAYETPHIVVGTIPMHDDRVVLVRRANEPGRGRWTYPGGHLEMGETLEEGALRETREETGLAVTLTGVLGVYPRPGGRIVTVIFQAAVDREEGPPDGEVLEVRAFAADQLPWDEIAFWTAMYALEDWLYARERGAVLPRPGRIGPVAT